MKRPIALLLAGTFSLAVLPWSRGGTAPASDSSDPDLYQAGKDLFDQFAPDEVKKEYDFPSREQFEQFLVRLQKALDEDQGRQEDRGGQAPERDGTGTHLLRPLLVGRGRRIAAAHWSFGRGFLPRKVISQQSLPAKIWDQLCLSLLASVRSIRSAVGVRQSQ